MVVTTNPDLDVLSARDDDCLFTPEEACAYLRVGRSTLRTLFREQKLVKVPLNPKTVRYLKRDLDACVAALRQEAVR